jgi:hypothetical protein
MTTPKPKRGRPKLPKGEGRTHVFSLRLSDKDFRDYEKACELMKIPFADWVREALKSFAKQG